MGTSEPLREEETVDKIDKKKAEALMWGVAMALIVLIVWAGYLRQFDK